MTRRGKIPLLAGWLGCLTLLVPAILPAEPVAVRYAEGLAHGFLVLRSVEGKILATGDLIQSIRAGRVTSQVPFHFSDGSVHDETGVFSQSDHFQLLTYHLVQKGPAFPQPLDMTINTQTAPLVGKQPPDTHVWILEGAAPAFVKSEGPLYVGGPIWRIELTSPVWPGAKR